jgi:DNA-directed RNA polymerase subunit M
VGTRSRATRKRRRRRRANSGTTGHPVVDGTQDAAETIKADCPADGCDGDRASYEMRPKPGGSYELRVFTCVECGHTWRET